MFNVKYKFEIFNFDLWNKLQVFQNKILIKYKHINI